MSAPTCGVCGREVDPNDPPPTFTDIRIGTTGDGKRIVQPTISKPIRMDPEMGAVCWCPEE